MARFVRQDLRLLRLAPNTMRCKASFAMTPTTGHCEGLSPEAISGIATPACRNALWRAGTGFALATTI